MFRKDIGISFQDKCKCQCSLHPCDLTHALASNKLYWRDRSNCRKAHWNMHVLAQPICASLAVPHSTDCTRCGIMICLQSVFMRCCLILLHERSRRLRLSIAACLSSHSAEKEVTHFCFCMILYVPINLSELVHFDPVNLWGSLEAEACEKPEP